VESEDNHSKNFSIFMSISIRDCLSTRVRGPWTLRRYYQTDIVSWTATQIILNHGGHWDMSTKEEMNNCAREYNLPFYIFRRDGKWVVDLGDRVEEFRSPMTIKIEGT